VHDQGSLKVCRVGAPHSHERLGSVRETSRCCVVCYNGRGNKWVVHDLHGRWGGN
jgi:hypothetical protein